MKNTPKVGSVSNFWGAVHFSGLFLFLLGGTNRSRTGRNGFADRFDAGDAARSANRRRFALSAFAERLQQASQAVVIDFVHQRELSAEFAARESLTGQPVEVVPGQVGNEPALVFSEGHGDGDEGFEVWSLHARIVHGFPLPPQADGSGSTEERETAPSRDAGSIARRASSLLD